MKRAHRRAHFAIWTMIGPIILWILYLALADIPENPGNEAIPVAVTVEAS
nr:hypothetical protein [Hyphomonas sp. Mor2]